MDQHGPSIQDLGSWWWKLHVIEVYIHEQAFAVSVVDVVFALPFRNFSINTDAINSVWSGFGVFLGDVFLRVCAVYKTWYFKLIIISYKYFSALLYFLKCWQDNLKLNVIFFFRFICEFPFFTYVVGLNFRYELFIQKNTEEAGKMSERGVKR